MKHLMRQRGTTTVEFAIVGMVLVTVLFGIIELGRIIFTLNVLQEGARRGARVAVICPFNDETSIKTAALGLFGENPANRPRPTVLIEYLNADGGPYANYDDIAFVRVSLTNYEFNVWVPFVDATFPAPTFSSTLPRESLGVPKESVTPGCKAGKPL